jgi:hypothetical protein
MFDWDGDAAGVEGSEANGRWQRHIAAMIKL